MIVYNDVKGQFVYDVKNNRIADKILNAVRAKGLDAGCDSEYLSWQNSMHFMSNIIDTPEIDNDVRICIEYNIPLTSKRVDFIIAGSDDSGNDNVVIVELKQWQKAEMVADDMHYSVRTWVANDNRIVCHPSYQAYSYSCFLKNFSETIYEEGINLFPCAYLHNYQDEYSSALSNPIYKEWIKEAPFFIESESSKFAEFIKKYISKKSSKGDLLYMIDHGRLRPTKALQDSLASMVKGNKEFMLLDEQAICYDMCLKTMAQCIKDQQKRTIIIQGGPGTGKSVLAINLLMAFINQNFNASYVTKSSAPREAFKKLLARKDVRDVVNIEPLFRSPFGLSRCANNAYDCLIVDESHRLVRQMYRDFTGENQVKECIASSLLSIFFLDEDQAVTTKDIGSVEEIDYWCRKLKSRLIMSEETKLISQFRCNGSDAYIQFIDEALQRKPETVHVDLEELNYDFQVFDDANKMRDELRKINELHNKARMVAGYCYNWDVAKGRGPYDIYLPNDFRAKWNLKDDKIWAINPKSFEEVGCIHTAQGLEFDYVGVLIGKDLTYNTLTGKVETHKEAISLDDKSSGIRLASTSDEDARRLILNTYKTLLTRGQKGCYVYCEDEALRDHFKRMAKLS
jgi:DUF2075 family protein